MKLITNKLKVKVGEGKRRLRLFISALLAISAYVYLIVNAYGTNEEEVFIEFPLTSIATFFVVYLLISLSYWVIEGFNEEDKKKTVTPVKEHTTRQDADSLATSFIRNAGNNFDRFCSKEGYTKLFQYNGPFFAWSMLWLAIRKSSKPDDVLRKIIIEALNKVLEVNHSHTLKAVDAHLREKAGPDAMGFAESGELIGLEIDRMFRETNGVFVSRLEEGINISLSRMQSGERHKFVPILDLLMARNSKTGTASEFDNMSDDNFEYIFLEQCVENFTKAQNMAFKILQEYRVDHPKSL